MEQAVPKKDAKPGVPYAEIRDNMKSGDVLLFRGSGLVSDAIAEVEEHYDGCGAFSHAGMVIRAKDLPAWCRVRRQDDAECMYVLESTASGTWTDGVPSILDNKAHIGVQLRNLDLVVEAYDANPVTRLAWLPLRGECRAHITDKKLGDAVERYLGVAYDASCIDLFAAAMPCMRCVRDNWCMRHFREALCRVFCCGAHPERWLFCSELVSQIFVDWGIFPNTVVPADVMPTDFLPAGFDKPPAAETSKLTETTATMDADHQVPWVFSDVVRYRH